MSFVLARHAESEINVLARLNGDPTVPCPLTRRGIAQARSLGEAVAGDPFELCVTSGFQRAEETADEALRGRDVSRLVDAGLGDPRFGRFEGQPLAEYRAWAGDAASSERPEPGGESRLEILQRYARSFRLLLARPERSILVVAHSLPVAYALAARGGIPPGPNVPLAEYATPYRFSDDELDRAAALLERWTAAPTW